MAEFNLKVSKDEIDLIRNGFHWLIKKAFSSLRKIKVDDILILENGEQFQRVIVTEIIVKSSIEEIANIEEVKKHYKLSNPRRECLCYLNKKFRKSLNSTDVGFIAIKLIVQ